MFNDKPREIVSVAPPLQGRSQNGLYVATTVGLAISKYEVEKRDRPASLAKTLWSIRILAWISRIPLFSADLPFHPWVNTQIIE